MNTRAGWYSVLVNLLLFGLNLAMAAYSGSLAMRAETAHNLMDLAASLSVLLGMALSERKSRDFPYGLYKLENVVAVLIAFGLFLTGYEIAREAVFAPPRAPDVRPVMLAGVALALLIPLAFSRYELRIGRAINSPSLIADANEFRAHILSSGVVFAGLAGQLLGLPLDRAAALLVVFWVGYVGWRTLVEGMRVLLDASLDAATLEAVRAVIAAQPEVAGVKTLTGRNSGRYRFIEAEVAVRVTDLEQAHRVATLLEEAIRAEVPHVERVLIHTEPVRRDILRVAFPLATLEGALAPGLGSAVSFAVCEVRTEDGAVLSQKILPAPQVGMEKGRGLRIAKWLAAQGIDVLVAREDLSGKAPSYVLQAAGSRVVRTQDARLPEALAACKDLGAAPS